jgi:H+/Na+-translocating ferredoxin:NAD+ oxidoreductase subunit G
MSKDENSFRKMVLALSLVCLIASASLGGIYALTKDTISASRKLQKQNAVKNVLPPFDNDPLQDVSKVSVDGDTIYFYKALQNGEWIGTAVETFTNKGFSGNIKLMVSFTPEGKIYNISVLEHHETPGLGDKMDKEKSLDKNTGKSWSSQFDGKNPAEFRLSVKKDGGDVDAITAATISSRAFCDAVQRAYNEFTKMKLESPENTVK